MEIQNKMVEINKNDFNGNNPINVLKNKTCFSAGFSKKAKLQNCKTDLCVI